VAERWPAFCERMEQEGGLPKFVVREFEEFLKCGIPEAGCLHLVCRSCGYSEVVAFSCKKRGFCPGCLGRRMADAAVHLEERVLPAVPIRHWICSLPWGLRALLGYDRELCAEVVSAFALELSRSLKRRAKRELDLASVEEAHTGAVCAVQRTDGALRLNVHLHVLALDGVYVRDGESKKLVFEALEAPSHREVLDVARRTAERIDRLLRERGRSLEPQGDEPPPELLLDEPGLASCYAAAAQGIGVVGERAGQPALRLICGNQRPPESAEPGADTPVAEHRGVNVHAKQCVDGRDRRQLERLCRYITRPPVAQDRLERRADGRLELAFKHPWKDGTRAVVLEADDLMVRLCAAVPTIPSDYPSFESSSSGGAPGAGDGDHADPSAAGARTQARADAARSPGTAPNGDRRGRGWQPYRAADRLDGPGCALGQPSVWWQGSQALRSRAALAVPSGRDGTSSKTWPFAGSFFSVDGS
jgi:hypothetical protein